MSSLTADGMIFSSGIISAYHFLQHNHVGFIAAGKSLYTVDLSTGAAKMMGNFREGNLIGVAVSLTSDNK